MTGGEWPLIPVVGAAENRNWQNQDHLCAGHRRSVLVVTAPCTPYFTTDLSVSTFGLGQCLSPAARMRKLCAAVHPRYNGRAIRTYEYCSDPTAKSASQTHPSSRSDRRAPRAVSRYWELSSTRSASTKACLRSSALSRRGLPGRFVSPTLIPLRSPRTIRTSGSYCGRRRSCWPTGCRSYGADAGSAPLFPGASLARI